MLAGLILYGTCITAGSIGYRGDGTRANWLTSGSTRPAISGVLADLRLSSTDGYAIQDLEDLTGSPLTPTKIPLIRWTDWAAAVSAGVSGFGRQAQVRGTSFRQSTS